MTNQTAASAKEPAPPARRSRTSLPVEEATAYGVYLELVPGEACAAHVAELPGCHLTAEDEGGALTLLAERIEQHRAWREGHGLPRVAEPGTPFVVKQAMNGPRPWAPNGASALFSIDRRLLTDQEFDGHLRVLACGRADLLRAAHAIPRGAFDDAVLGQDRTIREMLLHLADREIWLMSRLGRRITVEERDPLRRMVDVRARTLEHLMRYGREDRDLIFVPTEQVSEDPEEMWSLRKFLRRLIEHELDHMEKLRAAALHWSHGTGLE